MDIQKFTQMVRNPGKTKDDLKRILENARRKQALDHVDIVRDELDRQFPGWDVVRSRQGGSTPNVAVFRGYERSFDTAKEGYIWLIEKFIAVRPELFSDPSSETLYLALGKSRNYFGRNPNALFKGSPHLAEIHTNHVHLRNGWFANVNLNNAQKFDILLRFAALTRVEYPTEWEWKVSGATELLADNQRAMVEAKRLFDELFALVKQPAK